MDSTQATKPSNQTWKQKASSFFALFTSTGTLICCALPAAVAAFAGGAAVTSMISTFPWMVTLSGYKEWIFFGSGIMLLISGILVYRPKGKMACSITGGEGCEVAGRFTKVMLWSSIIIYITGAFFAYALVPIMRFLGI
ncbi:MAG: hypothetical protein MK198_04705 [Gracilimonas sp.]|uniref:hypothetical protein n=1 Tax=Gracilimonas sp. TaxID=1974203 RepID=UPI00375382AB|nr:hypothetical protein [Gracilimonas sp.]